MLAGLFWGDSTDEQARKSLRTTLWRIRRVIEPEGCPAGTYILVDHDRVGFNTQSDYWLDVEEFERCLANVPLVTSPAHSHHVSPTMLETLETAANLYQGDLFQDRYDSWCLYYRQRLQDMFLNTMATLMAGYRSEGRYEESLRCGQRILAFDPFHEEVHRELMGLYWLLGNRGAALRQYRVCQAMLSTELGVEPMEETTALYREIAHGREPIDGRVIVPAAQPLLRTGVPNPDTQLSQKTGSPLVSRINDMLDELERAQESVNQANARVHTAIEFLTAARRELTYQP